MSTWALSVWGAVLGSARLLVHNRWAVTVFGVSLATMVIATIYNCGLTDGVEIMGTFGVVFRAVIFAIAVALFPDGLSRSSRWSLGSHSRIDDEALIMTIARRIFVSSPRDEYLDDRRNELKWAIVRAIETLGYEAQVFGSPEGGRGLASGRSWSPNAADEVMQRCVGAAILGFPIWRCSRRTAGKKVALVTEYCHYEGAIARTYGLPILAVLEDGVEERVFFNRYAGDPFIAIPAQADVSWVAGSSCRAFLKNWNRRIGERRDIFLAYSGKLERTAQSIHEILTRLGATVLDWKRDFPGGPTILEQVEDAARRTSGGVFLFTRDDPLKGKGTQAAPRDNVIFEAGFFVRSKGHERVLIIREDGAKMPADLGGVIYEALVDRGDVLDLEERLRLFLETSIWSRRAQPSGAGAAPPAARA